MIGIDTVGSILIGHSGGNIVIDPLTPSRHFREMLIERLCIIVNQSVPIGRLSCDIGKIHIVYIPKRLRRILFIGFQVVGNLGQSG